MNPNSPLPSHRNMVIAGTSLLAAPLLGGVARAADQTKSALNTAQPMPNPLTQYAKPPFKKQH